MTNQEALNELLSAVKANIVKLQSDKGLRASGRSALSLRVEAKEDEGKLFGDSSFIAQEEGTKPGSSPDIQGLYDWLQYKKYGISYASDKQRWSIARAIANKQQESGSYIFRHGPTGVLSEALTDAMVDRFQERIAFSILDGLVNELKKTVV